MKLRQLTRRVLYYPFEEERDRPNLCYIRGDRLTLAVDAGHSAAHVQAFREALREEDLPEPDLTVLTHWHWDHTFGLHAVRGITIANARTAARLRRARVTLAREGREAFLSLHESIRREYPGDTPMVVALPDVSFTGELLLDLGDCPVRLFEAPSPHTDDSTLVHLPGEGMLLAGDACCGAFPSGEKDPALNRALAETIAGLGADLVLESHWTPVTKQELLHDMEEG